MDDRDAPRDSTVLFLFMAVSKKKRFEVFKRDSFTCQYCGSTPPKVVLEADHIDPKSKGGSDDINNLITACFDCNRGKSNNNLTSIPKTLIENTNSIKEKEEQYLSYNKLIKSIERRKRREIKKIDKIYSEIFKGWGLTESFKKSTLLKFLDHLTITEVEESAHKAFSYIDDPEGAIKYFCGICWNKIKGE